MTATLAGRSVLVTGASGGIGRAVAADLAAMGAWVGMVARTPGALREAADAVGGYAIPADLSSPDEVERVAREVQRQIGGAPDILVNAAGAFALAPFAETSVADFDRQLAVNLRAPFLVIRTFLPAMTERRGGHIVNVGSVAGRVPLPGNAGYGASKFGLRGLHEVLAAELRGTGVRATLIEPSATDTHLWDPLDPDRRDDLPSRAQMLPPAAVAAAVRYIVTQPESVEVSNLGIRAV